MCTELVVGGTGFLFQRAQLSDNWISTNLLSQGNLRIAIHHRIRKQAKFQVRLAGINTHTTLDTKRLTKFQAENFHLSALALSYRENNHGLRSHQSGPLRIAVLLSAPAPSDPALASSRERSWRIEDRRVTSFVLVFSHPEPRIDSDSGLKPVE